MIDKEIQGTIKPFKSTWSSYMHWKPKLGSHDRKPLTDFQDEK